MAEPWIRVHAGLIDKPVIGRVVDVLGVSSHEAIGLMVCFWAGVSQFARRGDLSNMPDGSIERWARWPIRRGQKRGAFAAFIRSHHLDADGRVREWDRYAGRLEDRKERSDSPDGKSTYVYYAVDGNECKIGWSGNPWSRVVEMRTARPGITLVATEKGPRDLEIKRHEQFSGARLQREWFALTDELRAHIRSVTVGNDVAGDVGTTDATTEPHRRSTVASRANEDDTKREDQQLVVVGAADAARELAIAANRGLSEHPTKPQPIPRIIASAGRSLEAAKEILAAGVPLEFATAEVYRIAKSHDADGVLTTLRYFTPGVVRAWQRQQAIGQRDAWAPPPANADATQNGRSRDRPRAADRRFAGDRNDAVLDAWAREECEGEAEVTLDLPELDPEPEPQEVHHGE